MPRRKVLPAVLRAALLATAAMFCAPSVAQPWPAAEKQKAAAIARLDYCVGQIAEQLTKFKAESNTVIVVTSDGGPRPADGVDVKFHRSAGGLRHDASGLKGLMALCHT